METVQVKKSDFSKILDTAEILIDKVEHAISQDELARSRLEDVKSGMVKGKTEKELDAYLKKRGIKIG